MGTDRSSYHSSWPLIATMVISAACSSCGSSSRASTGSDAGGGSNAPGASQSSSSAIMGSNAGASSAQTTTSTGTSSGADADTTAPGDATAGGASGEGGANGEGGASPSSGCGAASSAGASPQMINVTDKANNTIARQFYFALPTGYAPAHPYPLVFAWHYAGGEASTIAGTGFAGNYYGIQPNFPNAIYVAPQGLQGPAMADGAPGLTGWPNTNDQDIAFARAMVSWFDSNFCVDESRIMSTGFSYGGIMSHTIGCEMPDVFRAIGVMSGALIDFPSSSCVNHDIAAWITHGDADPMVPYSDGVSALNRIVTLDHCGSTTSPVTPSPCVQYDGCDSGEPVVWCSVAGEGHTIPNFAASAIASFFAGF